VRTLNWRRRDRGGMTQVDSCGSPFCAPSGRVIADLSAVGALQVAPCPRAGVTSATPPSEAQRTHDARCCSSGGAPGDSALRATGAGQDPPRLEARSVEAYDVSEGGAEYR
jgi:hypothetical protein